jgi:hypothetical protein
VASSADNPDIVAAEAVTRAAAYWQRLETKLVRIGDYLNPILVKETRQALKSQHFTITFGLVLAAQWIVTIIWLAVEGSAAYYSASGDNLFYWYYIILGIPLVIIIPFATYRSLQAEREDNTYELLSITSLSARQIIVGKLGSALLQMILFLSASVPCLAFTYMLRGIDILTIGLLLYYAVFSSITLSVLGIFFATLTTHRFVQVLLAILLIIKLLAAYIFGCLVGIFGFLEFGVRELRTTDFWLANSIIVTVDVTYTAMLFLAASAMLTFPTENRSTALRWGMLVQHACIAGWCAFFWHFERDELEACMGLMIALGVHWYFMGTLMLGESRHMSDRVMRSLPQSFFGRAFQTWLNPGPMTGYVFATVNLVSGLTLGAIGILVADLMGVTGRWPAPMQTMYFMVLLVSYVVIYLGIGNLILSALRRVVYVSLFLSLAVQLGLLLIFCVAPWVIQLMTFSAGRWDYSFLQIADPFWTLGHIIDRRTIPTEGHVLIWFLPSIAIVVFFCNLRSILEDVQKVRIASPQRVQEEDAELQPVVEPERKGPWDD